MRVALYARVSTDGQTTENQLRALREVAQHKGWTVTIELTDDGISGAKGRDQRPGFDKLCRGITRGAFDMVAVWSVDRLGRSLQHLVTFLDEIQQNKVGLYLHQQALDTSTPAGKALFQMLGIFAEFERSMIQERVHAGLARARAAGKRIGRPPATLETRNRIKALLRTGASQNQVCKQLRVSKGLVNKIAQEHAQ